MGSKIETDELISISQTKDSTQYKKNKLIIKNGSKNDSVLYILTKKKRKRGRLHKIFMCFLPQQMVLES
jgi:hypothetical protein